MSRKFEIEWSDFNVTVTVDLLDNENPELCEQFWQTLPFQTLFAASMSAGEMLKFPIPRILPVVPPEKLVLFPDEPLGTIISLGMGSALLKYGIVAEPWRVPRLGRIPQEELDKVRSVAMKVRDAYFFTKEINIANVRRKE